MIPSGIWALIGVAVGSILTFMFELIRDRRREKETKGKYLKDLLADLEYNWGAPQTKVWLKEI